jgi:hypothetical protein
MMDGSNGIKYIQSLIMMNPVVIYIFPLDSVLGDNSN